MQYMDFTSERFLFVELSNLKMCPEIEFTAEAGRRKGILRLGASWVNLAVPYLIRNNDITKFF